jgi:uncharacterized protein YehS (DUF1456 family)
MTNNDILRRIRYVFDFNDAKMMAIFALADLKVRRGHIIAWLLKDDDPAFEELNDRMLATFLNGLISEKRGKRDGPQPEPEKQLNNNIVLMKLKIAMDMRAEDIIATTALAGFTLTAPELSAFMRRPGHRNHRECKDQVLRSYLKGLQIVERETPASAAEEAPASAKAPSAGKASAWKKASSASKTPAASNKKKSAAKKAPDTQREDKPAADSPWGKSTRSRTKT